MSNNNPYADDDFAKASEHLRLAIALLSKHKIPPSPLNYRLGYDHVAGKNEELKEILTETAEGPSDLTNDELWETYRKLYVQDFDTLETMRQELHHFIANVQGELRRSGSNLSGYADTLSLFAEKLNIAVPPVSEVEKVIDETHSMEQSQSRLGSQMANILNEIDSLKKELEQVKEESLTDALTSVSNRKAFDAALEHIVPLAREEKTPFCILMADIDHFKAFNDTHGHLVGDKVLRFVAATLKRNLKGRDMAARFGGEEFAVILPQTKLDGATSVADQVCHAISSGELKDANKGVSYGKITVSIGVAQFRLNELPNELLQRVDRALYRAKELGRNRVEKAPL